ncbi:MAG: urea transporter [Candidatus Rokubacteria bacterium]|nr:urea transporter [Candidatus Rokubacteria bacterium]
MTLLGVARGAPAAAGAWAAAHGQVFFCASALSGLAFLVGFALLAPRATGMGAVGGAAATLVALARGYPRRPWRSGLYAYAGVLVGLYWGVLFEPGPATWAGLVAAAAASAPLTRLAYRLFMPRQIPTLALPALVLVWLTAPLLGRATGAPHLAVGWELLGWTALFLGLVAHSRLLALAGLLGALCGVAMSLLLGVAIEPGLIANTVPTAMALGAVYLPFTGISLLVAGLGAAAAGGLWWGALSVAPAWLPPLVAPFNLVTLAVLAVLRVHALRRWLPGCPAPLPLESITSAERSRAAWLSRRTLLDLVRRARRIGVLTGAGVSTETGLPDVRGAFGLGQSQRRVTLADFLASAEARAEYWRQEERFFRLVQRAGPAAAHHAVAALHRQGRLSAVVTQNVDGLHQAAGVPPDRVIEIHGNIHGARCLDCGHAVPRGLLSERIAAGPGTLYCERCQGLLKGGGVLFGEPVAPERLDAALRALLASDLWLVLGTSLAVAPVSDLLRWASEAGIPVAIINATPTPHDDLATVTVMADVGATLLEVADSAPRPPGGPPAVDSSVRSC